MSASPTRDRLALAFVILVWISMLVWALAYAHAYGPTIPFGDEVHLWNLLPPSGSLSWRGLWQVVNEHRIPLPRLFHYFSYVLAGDVRAPLYLDVSILAAAALLAIAVARRIRGRTVWSDSAFPLLFLHVGNWENLLSGLQIALMLPTALVCAIVGGIAISPDLPRTRRALGIGICLACLPLCGGIGLVQAPALATWAAIVGWRGRRSPEARERRGGWILLAAVALVIGLLVAYGLGYSRPPWYRYTGRPIDSFRLGAAILAQGLGPGVSAWWPLSVVFVASLVLATLVLLVRNSAHDPRERLRRLGLFTSIAGVACLVTSIGISRADSTAAAGQVFVPRYAGLSIPILACAYYTATLYGDRAVRGIVCSSIAFAPFAMLPTNASTGYREGERIRARERRFEAIVASGADVETILRTYTEIFPFHSIRRSQWILEALAFRHEFPFDRGPAPTPKELYYCSFSRPPSKVDSDLRTMIRWVDDHAAVLVHGGTSVRFDRRPGESRITGSYGMPSEIYKGRAAVVVRVLVEVVMPDGSVRALFDRTLDPERVPSDRGSHRFALDGLPDQATEIVLRTERTGSSSPEGVWSYWSEIRIE